MDDIHSCSYYCTRPACVLAQRDEMRAELARLQAIANQHRDGRLAALEELARLREQEPVAWVDVKNADQGPYEFHGMEKLPTGRHHLYAAAPPAQPAAQPARSTMTLAEFCAEGERLGVTAAGLADALKDRPEFADRKPAPVQEPMAWINYPARVSGGKLVGHGPAELSFKRLAYGFDWSKSVPLVASKPAAQPVQRLSDERIEEFSAAAGIRAEPRFGLVSTGNVSLRKFARLVEAALQPQGWVLVPVEPTAEMLASVDSEADDKYVGRGRAYSAWKSMIAARPGGAS